MKDNAIKWLTELNPFDKVKGHTKIELTDIHTGKKQVIEKDNAFQAGVLAKYMRSMGAYNNNPYANGTWAGQPIWRNLCGGIFCFEDTIDNSQDEVEYMPAGNTMVANGAYGVVNGETPVELGSYNSVESSTSGNDSVTFVYNFTSAQGNGTISCVCLTTEIGGYIGYGNPSGVAHSTKKSFSSNQTSRAIAGNIYKNKKYSFAIDTTNSKLTVTKTPLEITKGSIFDGIDEDAVDITYSGTVSGTSIWNVFYIGGGKFAILIITGSNQFWANNATYSFLIYDAEADTATVKTLTNTTGTSLIIIANSGSSHVAPQGMTDNYLYLKAGSSVVETSDLYAIKLSDNSYIKVVENLYLRAEPWPAWDAVLYYCTGSQIAPNMFLLRNGMIFDESSHTYLPINGSISPNYSHHSGHDALYSSKDGYLYKNPLILATINNLETPVTKTAAQTMKITYTLSKAAAQTMKITYTLSKASE